MIVSQMDHIEGEEWVVPAGGHFPQDRPSCLGSPLIESPRVPPSNGEHFRSLRRQTTGIGAGGHPQLDGGNHRETIVRRSRSSR